MRNLRKNMHGRVQHAPPCCQCAGPSSALLREHERYVASLDLWIVSSGGTGSNALSQQLRKAHWLSGPKANRLLRVRKGGGHGQRMYEETTHAPRPIISPGSEKSTRPPTLFILGDLPNALSSVLRQGLVRYNLEKILFGTNDLCCRSCSQRHLSQLIEVGHPDPFGIARQLASFLDADATGALNVAFVRYPVTRASVDAAFALLGMSVNTSSVNAKVVPRRPRSSSNWVRSQRPLEMALHRCYVDLAHAEVDLPAAFRAADAPHALLRTVRRLASAVNQTWLSIESGGVRTTW